MTMDGDTEWLPLRGFRVLDMADVRGEMCGRILGDLGADVVRLEPSAGAASRRLPPHHAGQSLYFEVRNANKRIATLDLETEHGRSTLRSLLEQTDIWIESAAAGSWEGLDLSPSLARTLHPRLIVTSITDFGQWGPYRDYVATDPVVVAMSSLLSRSGVVGVPPLLPPGNVAYDCAGVTAAFACLLALWHRDRTGAGRWIDVSALESLAQSTDWGLVGFSAAAEHGTPYAEVRDGSGPYPLFDCADGMVRMPILKRSEWLALRSWLGDPEELSDPGYETLAGRARIRDSLLVPACSQKFARRSKLEVTEEAQARRIAVTPVLSPREIVESPHFRSREAVVMAAVTSPEPSPAVSGLFCFDGRRAGLRHRAHPLDDLGGSPPWAPTSTGDQPPEGSPAEGLPLEGLLALDFGQGGVGVEIGRLLAEYGADVVKVEGRANPDFMRLLSGTEMTPAFASSSRSKRSFGVNIRTPEGLSLVHRLISVADLVIENSAPGAMDRLGVGWEAIAEINPRCVMLSSQLLGLGGPWGHWKGYGPNTRAAGGMTFLWNFPEHTRPPGTALSFPDHFSARVGAVGALAGLFYRRRFGVGTHVESAQVDSILYLLSDLVAKEGLDRGSVHPQGNRSSRGAPWGVYQCAGEERWCVITCRDDGDWLGLIDALGNPPWAQAPALATADGRLLAVDEIDGHLTAWTLERADLEVASTLQAHGVPAAPMLYVSDQARDPHLQSRGFVRPVDQPGAGRLYFDGPSFHSSGWEGIRIEPAPGLGDHTREIAKTLLGLDDAEIGRLLAAGVLDDARSSSDSAS
jgi:crotonobetainyl-CoA:carnitine CoA-transferase CaiB-like acyl-CoA transferase